MTQNEIFLYEDKDLNNPDRVEGVVPFRVNNETIFFGPGNIPFRKELRDRFFSHTEEAVPEHDIYVVGINELSSKVNVRKIVWVGKIKRIMTFETAFGLLRQPGFESLAFVPGVKNPEENQSPLHLEPIGTMGKLAGYRHRSAYHSKVSKDGIPDWVKDVADPREKREISVSGKDFLMADVSLKKHILKRDCCFTCENIFFADGAGLPITPALVKLLSERQPGQGVDEVGIFGYTQGRDGVRNMNKMKGSSLHIRWRVADQMVEYFMDTVG